MLPYGILRHLWTYCFLLNQSRLYLLLPDYKAEYKKFNTRSTCLLSAKSQQAIASSNVWLTLCRTASACQRSDQMSIWTNQREFACSEHSYAPVNMWMAMFAPPNFGVCLEIAASGKHVEPAQGIYNTLFRKSRQFS